RASPRASMLSGRAPGAWRRCPPTPAAETARPSRGPRPRAVPTRRARISAAPTRRRRCLPAQNARSSSEVPQVWPRMSYNERIVSPRENTMRHPAPKDNAELEALEQREWRESLDYVIQQGDGGRVQRLLATLRH